MGAETVVGGGSGADMMAVVKILGKMVGERGDGGDFTRLETEVLSYAG